MTDVVVVGAGLAGLQAALELQHAGLDVLVMEARQRVGGRIWSLEGPLGSEEAGAVNISEGYHRLQSHIEKHRLALEPVRFDMRDHTLVVNGQTSLASTWSTATSNPLPDGPWRAIPPLGLLPSVFARENPLTDSRSWLTDTAREFDVPCTDYLRSRGFPDEAIPLVDRASTLQSVREDSALNLLRAAQRMGRFNPQTSSIVGGNQRLPEAMAAGLRHPVRLGTEVSSVRAHEDDGVRVDLADGASITAAHVILAVPFPSLARIDMHGLLPAWLSEFTTQLRSSALTKFHITVERPFWKEDGLPVITWTDQMPQRLLPWRLTDDGVSSLAIWVTGWEATQLDTLPEDDQVHLITEKMMEARPAIKGAGLAVTKVISWGRDPYAGGAWAMPRAGQMKLLAEASQYSGGAVQLAGEHLAIEDSGLEGALETGDRAAQRIIERLR